MRKPQTHRVTIPLDQIELPPVSSGTRLSAAEKEAWNIVSKETLTGVEVVAEVEPEVMVAYLHWTRLMADPVFCSMPMNSPEFVKTMAGRLPDNVRRYLVETAGLKWSEAMQMPFKEILIQAARRLRRSEAEPPKPGPASKRPAKRKPRMGKAKVAKHWNEVMASGNRELMAFYLSAGEVELAKQIGTSRGTLRKVEAFQNRGESLMKFNRENR